MASRIKTVISLDTVWLASLGRPGLPRYVRIALTAFQGLTRVSPKCPACGTGHLGLAQCAWCHHVRASDRFNVVVRGSPEWTSRGRHREANRTHPMVSFETFYVHFPPVLWLVRGNVVAADKHYHKPIKTKIWKANLATRGSAPYHPLALRTYVDCYNLIHIFM